MLFARNAAQKSRRSQPETRIGAPSMPMPHIPDVAVFQRKLAGFPLATYQAGEPVLTAGSTTGRLLILKEGAVEVVRDGVQIAKVTEPGAVFGELSVLLNQPHTADLRALETSQFHVADAATLLRIDPIGLPTLQRSWPSASTAPIGPSSSSSAKFKPASRAR